MASLFEITGSNLTISNVSRLARNEQIKVFVSAKTLKRVDLSRRMLMDFIKNGRVIYGVNTGLGGFVDQLVPLEFGKELQKNLLRAVATNVGHFLNDEIVRASILARINSLARGNSGISVENLQKLIDLYNSGIVPCVPEKGSLGTSGDLGPLACIALVGIGEWKAKYKGEVLSGAKALKKAGIEPMDLDFKEGLALVNGTSMMVGMGSLLIDETTQLLQLYDVISALTLETLHAKSKPFDPRVHELKPHKGQLETAKNLWNILRDSTMIQSEDADEQDLRREMRKDVTTSTIPIEDAYSLRCTPQILGPIKDNVASITTTLENELNSSNDNPLIIPGQKEIFHNGHFHGQYVSMAMDQLVISLVTLSNLADRRIDRFMDQHHSNGLPPFLCKENPGRRLGLMGGQFMSASLAAENRSLAHPVSIQSLPSTADFQDIVSLGLVASRRAQAILQNTKYVIAFELLCACQAATLRGPEKLSSRTKKLYDEVRKIVPYLSEDVILTDYLEKIHEMLCGLQI